MIRRNILSIICHTLAVIAFAGGGMLVPAQAEEIKQSQTDTNNFRDPGSVPRLRSTTNVQREDAARRAAEYRAEKARSASPRNTITSGATTPDTRIPSKAGGEANE